MSEPFMLLPAFMGGLLLGAVFYGGLWWTVRKGLTSQRPALWFFISYLLRTVMIITGLYAFSGGQWQRLLSCLLGCLLARVIVMRHGKITESGNQAERPSHAA